MWALPYCLPRRLCWRALALTGRESQSLKGIFSPSSLRLIGFVASIRTIWPRAAYVARKTPLLGTRKASLLGRSVVGIGICRDLDRHFGWISRGIYSAIEEVPSISAISDDS